MKNNFCFLLIFFCLIYLASNAKTRDSTSVRAITIYGGPVFGLGSVLKSNSTLTNEAKYGFGLEYSSNMKNHLRWNIGMHWFDVHAFQDYIVDSTFSRYGLIGYAAESDYLFEVFKCYIGLESGGRIKRWTIYGGFGLAYNSFGSCEHIITYRTNVNSDYSKERKSYTNMGVSLSAYLKGGVLYSLKHFAFGFEPLYEQMNFSNELDRGKNGIEVTSFVFKSITLNFKFSILI